MCLSLLVMNCCFMSSVGRSDGVYMMADAFSMFDYGGGMGFVGLMSWGGVWVCFLHMLVNTDGWVVGGRLTSIVGLISGLFSSQVLGVSRVIYGFSMFCTSVFIYLSFIGIYSIFPYVFCVTAHFSHNFAISMVLWVSTFLLNFSVSIKGFSMHFTPEGLSWYQAAPVGVFEMVSNLSRLVTLGARLTMNMIAGKLLLCVGSAFLGAAVLSGAVFSVGGVCFFMVLLALMSWEMVVGVIQAYIFTFLSVTYVDEVPLRGGR